MVFSIFSNIFSYIFFMFGYISSSNLFPKALSAKEEEALLKEYFAGSKEAKDKLVEHNLRLVAHIAKKYATNSIDNEEYISIGTIGLIKGINSFSEEKGFKLSTYCSRCIENEILMTLRASKKSSNDVSINDVIGTDKDGNDMELIDIIESDDIDPIDKIYNKVITKQLIKFVNTKLPEREKQIIYMRYGLDGNKEKTQQEVADILGISRSYVSRIESKIQKKMNEVLGK